jgi:hypothetical protein
MARCAAEVRASHRRQRKEKVYSESTSSTEGRQMIDICVRRVVRRPERDALNCLAAFVAGHRVRDGKVRISLRLPSGIFATSRSSIARRVIATFYPLQSLGAEHPTYSVSWSARDGRPFPEFAGALAVEKLPCDDYFGLILSGHYEPPLGTMGVLFDAIVDHRIAHGLAEHFLRSIAAHLENISGQAVSMSRAREIPREVVTRMTQVKQRTTVPILALPFRNGIIRSWNQLGNRAVIREISTNRPCSCIISSKFRNRSACSTCHHAYGNAMLKRQLQPLDPASRAYPVTDAAFATLNGSLTRQVNQQASHHSMAARPLLVRKLL